MQAAVFAYGPSTLTLSGPATLLRHTPGAAASRQALSAGDVPLTSGIYQVTSERPIVLTGSAECDIYPFTDGSDVLPNPAKTLGRFAKVFPDVSYAWLCAQLGASAWQPTTHELSRIGIYVYAEATVVFDRTVTVSRLGDDKGDFKAGPGKAVLAPGIYRVIAGGAAIVDVSPTCDVLVTISGKTETPDISALLGRYRSAFQSVSTETLRSFFTILERGFHPQWGPESTLVGVAPAPR